MRQSVCQHGLTGFLAGGVSLLAISVAWADTVPADNAGGKIETVIVTAQKRPEDVSKVPVSISVLSSAKIKTDHIRNFADLTRAVPNLSFSSQAGEGLSTLELRGIASDAGNATVALYLDDVSLTTRNLFTEGTAEPRFLDIARVEVLRGPQGTLYGASAMGGALKYIANQPDPSGFSGNLFSEASGTVHGGPNWDEQGVLNIPLGNGRAALRIAAETGGDSGYIDNINPATGNVLKSGINSTGFNVARVSLLVKPTDWLSMTPSLFYQNTDTRDVDAQYLDIPFYETPKTVAEPGHDKVWVPSFTVNADLGFANLISVTSGYFRDFRRTLDSTLYNNLALYLCSTNDPVLNGLTHQEFKSDCPAGFKAPAGLFTALNNRPSYTFYPTLTKQFQQEVRLVSKPYDPDQGGLPVTWIIGAYYSDENTKASDNETIQGVDFWFQQFHENPSNPNVLIGSFPGAILPDPLHSGMYANDIVYQSIYQYDTAQYAAFGELTYHVLPTLRLTAGGRYVYARDAEFSDNEEFYSYGYNGPDSELGHSYAFTPKFALDWDVAPANSVYATASKGFRLGSENRAIPFIANQAGITGTPSYDLAQLGLMNSAPRNYGPDKLWNFEIGDKGRALDGRLVFSADVFYIKWDSIQQDIPLVTSGDDFQTNAGNATSYGFETELRGRVNDSLTVGVSGSYTHATLDQGILIAGKPLLGTSPGEAIPGVPRYNVDFDMRQEFIVNDRINGFVTADLPWVGPSHGEPIAPNPDYERPAYVTLNAAAGIDYGRWEFTLFGKNLTNNKTIIQRPDIQGSDSDLPGTGVPLYNFVYKGTPLGNNLGFTQRPLTVGINAAVKF